MVEYLHALCNGTYSVENQVSPKCISKRDKLQSSGLLFAPSGCVHDSVQAQQVRAVVVGRGAQPQPASSVPLHRQQQNPTGELGDSSKTLQVS
jgi:hypothetical protein